jgi:hypothetical protein
MEKACRELALSVKSIKKNITVNIFLGIMAGLV